MCTLPVLTRNETSLQSDVKGRWREKVGSSFGVVLFE
jgi:hypothetical protein